MGAYYIYQEHIIQAYDTGISDQLRMWAPQRFAYAQLSPLYPSLYQYVTHVINYTRPSPAFPYCKRQKVGRGLQMRLVRHGE